MAITASISLTVPALQENDTWFANAQAWTNYWKDVSGVVTINPVATSTYTSAFYDVSKNPLELVIDGTSYVFPTVAMLESLLNKVTVLDSSYQLLRNELVAGGLITNAQS